MTDNSQNESYPYEGPEKTWLPIQQHQAYDFDVPPQGYTEWSARDSDNVSSRDAGRSAIPASSIADSLHIPAALGTGGYGVSGDMHAAPEASSHDFQPYTSNFEPQLWHYPASQELHVVHDASSANMASAYYPITADYVPQYHVLPNHENSIAPGLARHHSQSDENQEILRAAYYTIAQSDFKNSSRTIEIEYLTPPPPMTTSLMTTIVASDRSYTAAVKPIKAETYKAPKKIQTRRSGPLDASTRMKADEMRDIGACWRCRKYKKPCNGHAGVCASCQVPGFRVWPSELGCRRERLDSLVLFLLPAHMEQKLQSLPEGWTKSRTWRVLKVPDSPTSFEIPDELFTDQWSISRKQARSLLLFDVDYAELANIAETYQSTRVQPIKALEASCTLLIAGCKLYQCFVNTPLHSENISITEIMKRATAVRVSLRRTFVYIQQLCLSTKRSDWFPAFLSASIATCTAIIFLDIVLAIPSPVREMIWGEPHGTISGLRHGGYQLLVDLLRASTNGVNPIKQQCWSSGGTSKSAQLKKSEERHTLLGVDTAAMEGLVALKAWQEKHDSVLAEGRVMMAADMYTVARTPPIASLCKIFDF